MEQKIEELKSGIKVHYVKTKQFKTNIGAIFITTPLKKETVTQNALIPAVLRRGTQKHANQEEISKELENMYGASFDVGVEKMGDNQIIKLYIETINDNFLPEKENILQKSIQILFEVAFLPMIENGAFKEEYVNGEKQNLKQIIESKIDNKDQYALNRCIEIMYPEEPYGIYKYGYVEELDKIDANNLYEQYSKLIQTSKIDIFISGDFEIAEVREIISQNEQFKNLQERTAEYIVNNEQTAIKQKAQKVNIQEEKRDVTQGKLVIGMDVLENKADSRFAISIYNTILGDSANSKLFQNVREKANLAYSTRSSYIRQKNNVFIRCGIDIPNYEKALQIIKEQLEDMKQGKFSEEELQSAKKYIISSIKTVQEEQDASVIYYLGQELSGYNISFEEYEEKIQKVNKAQVEEIANKTIMNSIYFLRN